MSPVISRLGQKTIAGPSPRTSTYTSPSTVLTLVTVERRLLEIQSMQDRAQHLVVDAAAVSLSDERLAFCGKHFQPQPLERRCRALADVLVVAAEALPRRVGAPGVPAPQDFARPLVYVGRLLLLQ